MIDVQKNARSQINQPSLLTTIALFSVDTELQLGSNGPLHRAAPVETGTENTA
jgi:hypothetical protein